MGIKCPKCQFENQDDTIYCGKCATPISSSEDAFLSQTQTVQLPIVIGSTIAGKYKILDELGRGGMGVVYKAEDTKLHRIVALKFLPPEMERDPQTRKRFIREAQAVAALDHPNICTVYEVEEAEGKTYIAMAYVEGQSLKQRIVSGLFSIEETLEIAIQVADGLKEAHKQGIVHRDIKISNIMLDKRSQAKVMDFGLAKVGWGEQVTREGIAVGTVAYMSPEQAKGEEVDHRSDIWSFGVVLYKMLTAELPFKGENEQSLMYAIINREPVPLSKCRADIPREIENVILTALAKNPNDRYQSFEDLLGDLRAIAEGLKPTKAKARPARTRIFGMKYVHFYAGLAALLVICAASILLIFTGRGEALNSIAVLPFRDLSPQRDQEHICEGMTEAIINKISVSCPELRITPPRSVESYKNSEKNTRNIGSELGVKAILDSTLQREGDNMRITARLINVQGDYIINTYTYSINIATEGYFSVQDEIAVKVAMDLRVELFEEEIELLKAEEPVHPEAYEFYLRGKHIIQNAFQLTHGLEDFETAVNMFKKALELEPNYALAYRWLGNSYQSRYVWEKKEEYLDLMFANYEKAHEIAPDLAEANLGLAWAHFFKEDLDSAYESFKIAYKSDPNNPDTNFEFGSFLWSIGLYKQAIPFYSRSKDFDPNYIYSYIMLFLCHFYSGERDQAEAFLQEALDREPENIRAYFHYIRYYLFLKIYDEAQAMLSKAEKISPDYPDFKPLRAWLQAAKGEREEALAIISNSRQPYFDLPNVYVLLGLEDEAIRCISEGIETGFREFFTYIYTYLFLVNNPCFDRLRENPRFLEIVRGEKDKYEMRQKKYGRTEGG
ncbi:MAG: FlgO family outer membrane protein [Candidatus Aminicenantes bacterium]|nr:FlgO family outer membrane protein [Candidatus Aminicenantes bacterium]